MRRFCFYLSLFVSLCILFIGLSSISYASTTYVISDYKGTGEEIIDKLIEDNFAGNTYSSDFYNNLSACINALDNYNHISIDYKKGTGTYWTNILTIKFSNNTMTLNSNKYTLNFSGAYINYQFSNYRGSCSSSFTNQTSSYSLSINNYTSSDMACFVTKNQSNYWYVSSNSYLNIGELASLKFVPFNNNITTIQGISNIHLENFSRSVNEWRIGTLVNFDSYTQGVFEMYQGEGSQWLTINNVVSWNSNGEVYLTNNKLLYYQLYRVAFYDYDYNYTETFGYYFLPYGVTYSGEGLIYNGNDNNNSSPVISQLEENQSFWEKTYNDLFTMNSGDYNEVYNLVLSYFPSGDTPISIYETIFGGLNNEPDDFIIRWDDVPINITWFNGQTLYSGDFIHANSINISKTCREDPVLSQIKFWINTFVMIGFLMLFYRTLYNCICHMLGVISEDVGQEDDNYKRNDIGFKM